MHRAIQLLREQIGDPRVSSALELLELRRSAATKFRQADRMFFLREALEQSSGEIVSGYRAARYAGRGPVADLACGIGGDTLSLAAVGEVTAVDQDAARLACLRHNLTAYNRSCRIIEADVTAIPPPAPFMFIDPSRRNRGRRIRSAEAYSPPFSFVIELASRVEGLGVKLSPAMDIPYCPVTAEIEAISLDGVCRELLLWTGDLRQCARRASVLRRTAPDSFEYQSFSLYETGDNDPTLPALGAAPKPGDILFEPDPAIIRARLVGRLGETLQASVLDPQIAYLISSQPANTPFAACYRILDSYPFDEKRIKRWIKAGEIGDLTIKKRGFPLTPEQMRSRLRPRGPNAATIILTRQRDRHFVMVVDRK